MLLLVRTKAVNKGDGWERSWENFINESKYWKTNIGRWNSIGWHRW